jgi:hypothetical protein
MSLAKQLLPPPNPSPRERGLKNPCLAVKVLSFGEDLGEAKQVFQFLNLIK